MSIFQILKILLVLPGAWIDSFRFRKNEVSAYYRLQKWSKRLVHFIGFRFRVEGEKEIPQGEAIFFVSNHQGTFDPVLVVATSPTPMAFVSKKQNEKLPIFGRWARNIGTIHFDRDTREGNIFMLREAARTLKKGKSLLIFPEGTRSKQDDMNEFKAGALAPAYLAKVTIVPITLNQAYCFDVRGTGIKEVGITYGKPIRYEEYKDIPQEEFSKELSRRIAANIKKQVRD